MKPPPEYLESYIVPVCRFSESSGKAIVSEFFGTAFFINSAGTFLTAKHVIDTAKESVKVYGGFLGLCTKPPKESGNTASPIISIEAHNPPYDICIGTISSNSPTFFTLTADPVSVWREVASFGYPSTAQNRTAGDFWMYGRGFRGYVHREIKAGQLPGGSHPDAIETNFAMPQGLSGGPLFMTGAHNHAVIGVCVGVNRGETTEFLFEELQDDGVLMREKRLRIEEYGIAHDIRPLLDWRPEIFGGLTLKEISGK